MANRSVRWLAVPESRCAALLAAALLAAPVGADEIVSDDFNGCAIQEATWTLIDPLGDAVFQTVGAGSGDAVLVIDVPGGVAHDAWTDGNFAPRIMQTAPDADLDVQVKFDSPLTETFQTQGIFVEQEPGDFLRFELHAVNGNLRLFAASFAAGTPTVRVNRVIPQMAPMHLRVQRQGDQWTISHSPDGAAWTTGGAFTFPLGVTTIGPYAGNAGTNGQDNAPPHIALIDFFMSAGDPIDQEDAGPPAACDPPGCPTDTNGDGVTDVDDVIALILDWGTDGSGHNADVTGDGFVNIDDLVEVILAWGPCDLCPDDPDKTDPGQCGCGVPDADGDGDGVADCNDLCPGQDDVPDSDGDGVPDCLDQCDGADDTADGDGDGTPDCLDGCPDDPDKTDPGTCGCGVADLDGDGDGVLDCQDVCPGQDDTVDADGNGVPDCLEGGGSDTITFDLWYGSHQVFGVPGQPQNQVNVLGNVSSPDGIQSLVYSLNGGPEQPLSLGPNPRRLPGEGDFNVEIFYDELSAGLNQLTLRAVDGVGEQAVHTVTVEYVPGAVWPLPYAVDWSAAADVQEAADVVDGQWEITPAGLHDTVAAYDRLVVMGDITWTDYEVIVPITVHEVDPGGYGGVSGIPHVGVLMRWPGHSDNFMPGAQPSLGWWPFGGYAGWVFNLNGCGTRAELYTNPWVLRAADGGCSIQPELEVTYVWKTRVRTLPGQGQQYQVKVWEQGQAEPADWLLSYLDAPQQPGAGCVGLLAHHVRATFGDVQIQPIDPPGSP